MQLLINITLVSYEIVQHVVCTDFDFLSHTDGTERGNSQRKVKERAICPIRGNGSSTSGDVCGIGSPNHTTLTVDHRTITKLYVMWIGKTDLHHIKIKAECSI